MLVDLRSDTVTQPSAAMLRAMSDASLRDNARDGDPTVASLEEKAAGLTGKDAGLFVPSGTMGNIATILTRTRSGDRIVVESRAHIYRSEHGGYAELARVEPIPIEGESGAPPAAEVKRSLDAECGGSIRLVCLETTHNAYGGVVASLAEMEHIYREASSGGVSVHLDGARVFNASVHLGCPVAAITKHADSVVFSLSKGLGAPVGSLLCGSREFISAARQRVKMLGGAMRQIGPLAAAGLIALEDPFEFLENDHRTARRLAECMAALDPLAVEPASVVTNIVNIDLADRVDAGAFEARLRERGVLIGRRSNGLFRLVTHRDIGEAGIDHAIRSLEAVWAETGNSRSASLRGVH
ncbi:MAG: hypothetical protein EA385_00950 [Salinarimonadaceae bacterium]|nr:MAG: hypothetical protein EA385_00950 [Salinarimonadaceae bacterium]